MTSLEGKHRRAAKFLSKLITLNPHLANQVVKRLFTRLPSSNRDDLAVSLLQGGLNVKPLELHPSAHQLNSECRAAIRAALSSGWKTQNELTLLRDLKSLMMLANEIEDVIRIVEMRRVS